MYERAVEIEKILHEHETFVHYLEVFKDWVDEHEDDFLDKVNKADFSDRARLVEGQKNLLNEINNFYEGTIDHTAREEKAIGPVLGHAAAAELTGQHTEIKRDLLRIKALLAEIWLENMSQAELESRKEELARKSREIKQTAEAVSRLVESHIDTENNLFKASKKITEKDKGHGEVPGGAV